MALDPLYQMDFIIFVIIEFQSLKRLTTHLNKANGYVVAWLRNPFFFIPLCFLNSTSVQAAQMGQQAFHRKVECNSEKELWKANREKRITY